MRNTVVNYEMRAKKLLLRVEQVPQKVTVTSYERNYVPSVINCI